jgi:cytidine deaminase
MAKQQHSLRVHWTSYAALQELPLADQQLMQAARKALAKAHAPYSEFRVGAAILLDNGEIVSGANFENAAYTMCLCAERTALATAVSTFPKAKALVMAITVANPHRPATRPGAPCGACRQVLLETELRQQADCRLLLQGESGEVWELASAKDLLPFYFDGSLL